MTATEIREALEALACIAIAEGLGDGFEIASEETLGQLAPLPACDQCQEPKATVCLNCL